MVHRVQITERRLLYQFIGAGTVETHPVIFPGFGVVGGVGDQLVGFGQKKISFLQGVGNTAHLIDPLAGYHQMNQVMVPHAGAPGMPRFTVFVAAIEYGQFHIVRITLLVRLFAKIGHDLHLVRCIRKPNAFAVVLL